jgi:hypothetical protein
LKKRLLRAVTDLPYGWFTDDDSEKICKYLKLPVITVDEWIPVSTVFHMRYSLGLTDAALEPDLIFTGRIHHENPRKFFHPSRVKRLAKRLVRERIRLSLTGSSRPKKRRK